MNLHSYAPIFSVSNLQLRIFENVFFFFLKVKNSVLNSFSKLLFLFFSYWKTLYHYVLQACLQFPVFAQCSVYLKIFKDIFDYSSPTLDVLGIF